MTDRPEDSGQTVLDMADHKMLAEIKANVLGTSRVELRIGRFRVLERLGEGSMGIVFAAADDQLQRRVAIKLLHQAVGASEGERKARLFREAQILAQLQHPNIVQVYEVGEHDGQVFMAMELVEGQGLDELQRDRPQSSWRALLSLYITAGYGLAAAHTQGVVHRDFKPHNVLVDAKGRVRVVDFGLARESAGAERQHTAEIPVAAGGAIERPRGDHLTATGAVPGTPAYMAPELFDGQPASPASDQFSFCVALYEGMYGRRPFEGGRLKELVEAARNGRILPPPADRKMPRWLFEVLIRGLAASPEARYPGMEELLAELGRDRALRWKQAGVAVTIAVAIGATWWASSYTGDAAISRRHREACQEEAAELEALWNDAKEGLARPPVEREDMDGLMTMLDVDAREFFRQWSQTCTDDVAKDHEPCWTQAKRSFETVLDLGKINPLHESGFHELSYELALCVEGEASSRCVGPEAGSPAVAALGDARAAELVGDLVGAREHVERAIVLANEANDELTRLAAMLRKGALLESAGELDAARVILDGVEFDALACRSDVLALDAALELAEVEVLHSGDLAAAERALAHADTLLGMPEMQQMPLRLARALEKRGNAALLEYDCSEARAMFERALELRNGAIEERTAEGLPTVYLERLAANAQLNLATIGLSILGNDPVIRCPPDGTTKEQVLEQLRAAKDRMLRAVGDPLHPDLAELEFNEAMLHMYSHDSEAAIVPLQAVLSIYTAQHGAQSPVVGDVHHALANAYGETRRFGQARQHAETDLEIRILHRKAGVQQLALAEAYDILGLILHEQKEPDGARANLTAAVDTLRERSREALELSELEQLYRSELNLTGVELDLGEWTAVLRLSEQLGETRRALEAKTGKALDPAEDLAQQRIVDAVVLLDDGKPHEALARIEGIEERDGYDDSAFAPRVEQVRERARSMN